MAEEKNYDIDGSWIVTEALKELLNAFPLLNGEKIEFSYLPEGGGKGMFPLSGAVIESSVKDILGRTTQICQYPFYVIYRAGHLNADRRARVKEWLDDLGRWLEKQPIISGPETVYRLQEYPALTGKRKFTEIRRTSPAAQTGINDNNTEDWTIGIVARYRNEF